MTRLSIGVLCAAAFMLILIILSGNEIDDTSGKAIGTAIALAFLSLTAVAGSHLSLRQPQLSLFGLATVAASALAFLVTSVAIWSGWESDNWKPAIYTLIVAFACGHTSVLLAGRDQAEDDSVKLIRGATVALLWLLVVLAIAEISSPGNDVDPQGIGVVAVLYALGTILLPLLRRLGPGPPGHNPGPPGTRSCRSIMSAWSGRGAPPAPSRPSPLPARRWSRGRCRGREREAAGRASTTANPTAPWSS